ncbi:MAG: PDZ domain-containing protein, partial [FCB group bacterium]|nr:PDZ domain-containing protein [FCB group bacterium]
MKTKFSRIALILSLFSLLLITVGMVAAKKYSSRGPWIGVHMQSIDEDLRDVYELDDVDGIYITEVSDDSPADDAGLRRRDIIIKFDGKKVTEPDFLADLVEDTEIGDEVEITYLRRGKEKTAMVEIGRKPRSESYGLIFDRGGKSKNKHYQYSFSSSSSGHIGVVVQSLEDQLAEYFGVD